VALEEERKVPYQTVVGQEEEIGTEEVVEVG
jgi:hypothetical protein